MDLGWYGLLHAALEHNLFLSASALMYVLFAMGLYSLGAKHQYEVVHGKVITGQFPDGYFTTFAVHLVPLIITGILISDIFIIGTRGATLVIVVLVFAMVKSKDGTFNTPGIKFWLGFCLTTSILLPLVWAKYRNLQEFVRTYEFWIAWGSVAFMLLFVIKGQMEVAKTLFRHFRDGNDSMKRTSLQFVRLFAFGFQAVHYFYSPSGAEMAVPPWVWNIVGLQRLELDPIFINGALGVVGVLIVLMSAGVGAIFGSGARYRKGVMDRRRAVRLGPA